jgi:hypothetical protein
MSNFDISTYYHYAPEVWDAATCSRIANRTARDGFGTKYPFKGYIGSAQTGYGVQCRNGGVVIDGEWYPGYVKPLPVVADGFGIIHVLSWGWRLVRT